MNKKIFGERFTSRKCLMAVSIITVPLLGDSGPMVGAACCCAHHRVSGFGWRRSMNRLRKKLLLLSVLLGFILPVTGCGQKPTTTAVDGAFNAAVLALELTDQLEALHLAGLQEVTPQAVEAVEAAKPRIARLKLVREALERARGADVEVDRIEQLQVAIGLLAVALAEVEELGFEVSSRLRDTMQLAKAWAEARLP